MTALKLLLTGVPGTGKTTLGEFLSSKHGFFHVDMEKEDFAPKRLLYKGFDEFVGDLAVHAKVVLSWGFGPYIDAPMIKRLKETGFLLVWLDGDRVTSFKKFMEREEHDKYMEHMYYSQMSFITATEVVAKLDPLLVNPFAAGDFRSKEEIANEVLQLGR